MASEFRPYAPRARWVRTANDSYLTAMTYPEGLPSLLQPRDLHDAIWGIFASVYGGAVHPTAEGHAAMADAALPAAREVLGLPSASKVPVFAEPLDPAPPAPDAPTPDATVPPQPDASVPPAPDGRGRRRELRALVLPGPQPRAVPDIVDHNRVGSDLVHDQIVANRKPAKAEFTRRCHQCWAFRQFAPRRFQCERPDGPQLTGLSAAM